MAQAFVEEVQYSLGYCLLRKARDGYRPVDAIQ